MDFWERYCQVVIESNQKPDTYNYALFDQYLAVSKTFLERLNTCNDKRLHKQFVLEDNFPIFVIQTTDKGMLPILPSSFNKPAEIIESCMFVDTDNVVRVENGYPSALLNAENLQQHFRLRRQASGSLNQYKEMQKQYRIENVTHSELIANLDDFKRFHSHFEIKMSRVEMDSSWYDNSPLVFDLVHHPGCFDVNKLLDENDKCLAYIMTKDYTFQGKNITVWLATYYDPDIELDFYNKRLGRFVLNSLFERAMVRGRILDLGIWMEYKDLWKPTEYMSVPGLEFKNVKY